MIGMQSKITVGIIKDIVGLCHGCFTSGVKLFLNKKGIPLCGKCKL